MSEIQIVKVDEGGVKRVGRDSCEILEKLR